MDRLIDSSLYSPDGYVLQVWVWGGGNIWAAGGLGSGPCCRRSVQSSGVRPVSVPKVSRPVRHRPSASRLVSSHTDAVLDKCRVIDNPFHQSIYLVEFIIVSSFYDSDMCSVQTSSNVLLRLLQPSMLHVCTNVNRCLYKNQMQIRGSPFVLLKRLDKVVNIDVVSFFYCSIHQIKLSTQTFNYFSKHLIHFLTQPSYLLLLQ